MSFSCGTDVVCFASISALLNGRMAAWIRAILLLLNAEYFISACKYTSLDFCESAAWILLRFLLSNLVKILRSDKGDFNLLSGSDKASTTGICVEAVCLLVESANGSSCFECPDILSCVSCQ